MSLRKRTIPSLERTVTYRLHALSKLTDRVTQAAFEAETGIGLSEGRCLATIGSFSPLSVMDLASKANLDKGQASRGAQRLVEMGLVHKGPNATDGRSVVLVLTSPGRRVWLRLLKVIERRNSEIASCLDEAERKQLDDTLDRLVAHSKASVEGLG